MKCFVAGRVSGRDCYGIQTRHHIVARGRLRKKFPYGARLNPWCSGLMPITGAMYVPREQGAQDKAAASLPKIIADTRNLVDACAGCHVGLIETGNPDAQVQPHDLPDGFWTFIKDFGLWGDLPRHMQGLVPAAQEAT